MDEPQQKPLGNESTISFVLARDSLRARAPQRSIQRMRRWGYQRFLLFVRQINPHYFWEKRWFFISLVVALALMQAPLPEDLSREGQIVLAMSLMATMLFITEPIPLPTVALMVVIGQVVLLGHDSTEVAKSLMTDSVLFIMGSLMLAVAVVKQKLDKRIAWAIVRVTGTKPVWICFGISVVSGILASFAGEHTVAAMMLPVGLTLITLTSPDNAKVRNLAACLLLSISYGCSIAGIGTPSGGARNAIMIGYWKEFFYDPASPETARYLIDYAEWMMYAYPIFLLQLPFVTLILFSVFRPQQKELNRAVAKLRAQVLLQGPMRLSDWLAVLVFALVLSAWILASEDFGMGVIALCGAALFLIFGLVRWEEIDAGVNWGVVLLYAAAISLGLQIKDTGAALWVAKSFLTLLAGFGAGEGMGLWAAVSSLTVFVTNTMSSGATVAVLGPIVLKLAVAAEEDPIIMGFIASISSAFAYLTVVGAPACTIVYASGYLKTTDFIRVGWRMVVMSATILLAAAAFYWPWLGG